MKVIWAMFIVGLALAVSLAIASVVQNHWDIKYRQGQIDALTGKIHYELITHDDSTRTWERIE